MTDKEKTPLLKKKAENEPTLPPQKSIVDTTNWEKRTFTATSIQKNGKRVQRNTFMWLTDVEL
jgi:hypothetical protein